MQMSGGGGGGRQEWGTVSDKFSLSSKRSHTSEEFFCQLVARKLRQEQKIDREQGGGGKNSCLYRSACYTG